MSTHQAITNFKNQLGGRSQQIKRLKEAEAQLCSTLKQKASLEAQIESLKATNVVLQEHAAVDSLTGLLTRREFIERSRTSYAEAEREIMNHVVITVDIDHFKTVNDTYGHHIGDLVLCAAGYLLAEAVRPRDLVSRFGGEEFVILAKCRRGTGRALATARTISERILTSFQQRLTIYDDMSVGVALGNGSRKKITLTALGKLEETILHNDEAHPIRQITASIGFTALNTKSAIARGLSFNQEDRPHMQYENLCEREITGAIGRADKAMYKAKEGGRNGIAWKPEGGTPEILRTDPIKTYKSGVPINSKEITKHPQQPSVDRLRSPGSTEYAFS